MVRLVAVAVGDDDVPRLEQGLVHHLVRGRRAVRHEEHAVRAERARGRVLGLLDVAGGLEEAVEPAGRGRGLREEQGRPVELAHVADPVRAEDRLAARDREGVEGADRLLRVPLQVVEVGRLEALRHAGEDREVDLEGLLDLVEHAPQAGRGRIGEDLVRLAVGEEEDVELRPDLLRGPGEEQAEVAPPLLRVEGEARLEPALEERQVVRRGIREAVVDHDRLEVRVEDDGEERVLERPHQHRLVDELVLRAPELPDLLDLRGPAARGGGGHEQRLEVGTRRRLARRGGHRALADRPFLVRLPLAGLVAVAARHERARHPLHQAQRPLGVPRAHPFLEGPQQAHAREGLQGLEGAQQIETPRALRLEARPRALRRPRLGGLRQVAPAVVARRDRGEEVVQTACGFGGRGHRGFLASRDGPRRNELHLGVHVASFLARDTGDGRCGALRR